MGNVHHVNSVESFWRLFKASIRGTHVQISKKYAERYVNEFCFRQKLPRDGERNVRRLVAAV
ncbi:MAG: transposase [Rhizomicrobium sp.]